MLPSVQLSDLSDIYPHTHRAKRAPQNAISDCGTNQHYHHQECESKCLSWASDPVGRSI